MYDVITIGSATRDVFLSGKVLEKNTSISDSQITLSLGAKLEMEKIVLTSGGGATNAAVTFARQGMKVACLGVVGDDLDGQEIVAELEREGVVTDLIQKHQDDHTGYSTILVHPKGERVILSYKGEGQHFNATNIPLKKLEATWFYISSVGGNSKLLSELFEHAKANNIKIAFNPGQKELELGLDQLALFLKPLAVLTLNREEGAGLVSLPGATAAEVLDKLAPLSDGIIIVTDGVNGATLHHTDGSRYFAPVPDSPVVERTGAGDAFASGFVAEHQHAGDVVKALQFGTANASSVVTQFGAKAGILKKDNWGGWPLVKVIKK